MYRPDPPNSQRRTFLKRGITAAFLLPFLQYHHAFAAPGLRPKEDLLFGKTAHPLNILILGGTSFLGPHQIAYAMQRGHSITTFTRGKTVPTVHKQLFKEVEMLIGDRNDNLEALRGRQWDAVIDNSGHRVQWTVDTAELLKDQVGLYLYTSSTGVYYPYLGSDIQESTELVLEVPADVTEFEKMEYDYGVMKANSERAAQKAFPERTIVVRPTYMMGPADRTDRFTYWPVRLSRGGEVMVAGKPDDPVQFIDVRDVAEYMIRLIEQQKVGVSNAVGPHSPMGMQAFVHGAHAAFSSPVSYTWVTDYNFLEQQKVYHMVPWIPPTGGNVGSALINNEQAIANGLTFRPLARSVRDIYEWWESDAVTEERRHKMVAGEKALMAREKAILAAWKKRR